MKDKTDAKLEDVVTRLRDVIRDIETEYFALPTSDKTGKVGDALMDIINPLEDATGVIITVTEALARGHHHMTTTPLPYLSTCVCTSWATDDLRVMLLTGHHRNCEKCDEVKALYALVKELADAIGTAAQDTDGIHPGAWLPFVRAKSLEGVYLPEDPTGTKYDAN